MGAPEIATSAVGGAEVLNHSLTAFDLGSNSVRASELAGVFFRTGTGVVVDGPGQTAKNGNYIVGTATASCSGGEQLIGGSGEWDDEGTNDELAIQEVTYSGLTVTVKGMSDWNENRTLRARAFCLRT